MSSLLIMEQNQLTSADKRSECRLPPAPSVAPWLVIPYEKGMKKQAFYNPCESTLEKRNYRKLIPELNGKVFWQKPSHGGWLVVVCNNKKYVYNNKNSSPANSKFGDCFLWNPVTLQIITLPSLLQWVTSRYCIVDCTLSSPPSGNNSDSMTCFVFEGGILSDGSLEHVLVYCSPGDQQWRKKQLLRNDLDYPASQLKSILSFQGKLYAFYHDEWHMEIEKQHDQTLATRHFRIDGNDIFFALAKINYVECGSEILRVMQGYWNDMKAITLSKIQRLDFSSMSWAAVKSLDDHVLFIGHNTVASCSAEKMGLSKGRLFYVRQDEKSLYELDVEDSCTKLIMPISKLPTPWFAPEWIMLPGDATTGKRKRTAETLLDKFGEEEGHQIKKLKVRAVEAGQLKIPATSWRLSSGRTKNTYLSPWLVFLTDNGTIYNFVNPMHTNEKYFMNCSPQLAGAIILFSKDGWLLMSKGKTKIFFYNPITRETIPLPDLPDNIESCVPFFTSFSALPTSPDCTVFATLDKARIFTIKHGHDNWRVHAKLKEFVQPNNWKELGHAELTRVLQPNSPSFLENFLQADLEFKGWEVAKNFLEKLLSNAGASFVVPCDGNFLLVHLGRRCTTPVGIFKLDSLKKNWVKVQSLGNYMLFVSTISSFAATAPPNSNMQNKVYFPRLHGEGILYYSLETGKYHVTGSEFASDDFGGSCDYLNASWIQPNWCASTHQELDWLALP